MCLQRMALPLAGEALYPEVAGTESLVLFVSPDDALLTIVAPAVCLTRRE